MEHKQINFNSFLVIVVGAMVAIIGFFCKHQLDILEKNISETHALIMPRQEIEVQLTNTKEKIINLDAQIIYFRTRIDQMELDMARIKQIK